MLELYQHDLSEIWDQDLDSHGEYGYALDRYWDTEGFRPFVAIVNGKYAGFALVNQAVRIGTHGVPDGSVLRPQKIPAPRRRPVACTVCVRCLARSLELGQMTENHPAQAFWRGVISTYTGGRFKEHEVRAGPWQGIVQVFESTALQRRLTPPFEPGRPKGRFAPFGPPLMSNVRPHEAAPPAQAPYPDSNGSPVASRSDIRCLSSRCIAEAPVRDAICSRGSGHSSRSRVSRHGAAGYAASLQFEFKEGDAQDRARAWRLAGGSVNEGPGKWSETGAPLELKVFVSRTGTGDATPLVNEVVRSPRLTSWGGHSLKATLVEFTLSPGTYKVSVESLQAAPTFRNEPVGILIGAASRGK